jgi:hypothetical protein
VNIFCLRRVLLTQWTRCLTTKPSVDTRLNKKANFLVNKVLDLSTTRFNEPCEKSGHTAASAIGHCARSLQYTPCRICRLEIYSINKYIKRKKGKKRKERKPFKYE